MTHDGKGEAFGSHDDAETAALAHDIGQICFTVGTSEPTCICKSRAPFKFFWTKTSTCS